MIINDNGVEREMTSKEIEAWEVSMAEVEAFDKSISDAFDSRIAILKKLGLTDSEARLLLS